MLAQKLLFATHVKETPDVCIASGTTGEWWFGTLNKEKTALEWENMGALLPVDANYYKENIFIDPEDGIWYLYRSGATATLYNIDKRGTVKTIKTFPTDNLYITGHFIKHKNIIAVTVPNGNYSVPLWVSKDKGQTWTIANPLGGTTSVDFLLTNGNWWFVGQKLQSGAIARYITQDFSTYKQFSVRSSGGWYVMDPDGGSTVWHLNASGIDQTNAVNGTGYTQIYSGQNFVYGAYIGGGYVAGNNSATSPTGKVGLFVPGNFAPANITFQQYQYGQPFTSYLNPSWGPPYSRSNWSNFSGRTKFSLTGGAAARINFTNNQSTGSNVSFGFSENVAIVAGSTATLVMISNEDTFTKLPFLPTNATNTIDLVGVKNDITRVHKRVYS